LLNQSGKSENKEQSNVVIAEANSSTSEEAIQLLSKAIAHPLRIKILVELNKRVMSPSQFFRECGGESLSMVSRHFRQLVKYGYLELVEERRGGRRRGAVEHFYRAIQRPLFEETTWTCLPDSVQEDATWETFHTYGERVKQAFAGSTINSREDRHFTWTAFHLDQQAWDEGIRRFDGLFHHMFELAQEAAPRIAEGAEPIPVTAALAMFESPAESPRSS
jgi:DNA-binding transcriptional ArsR family regulator